MSIKKFTEDYSPVILSLMRIIIALLYMQHGAQKLFDFPAPMGHAVELFSLTGIAGIIEFFGGLLVAIGLFTRTAAFITSGEMATAYFMAHVPHGFWPLLNQGELAAAFCLVFLYLAFTGAGPLSLDRVLRKVK